MNIKGETLQEHIWNDNESISEYAIWDWVNLFHYFGLDITDEDYESWIKSNKKEGILYPRKPEDKTQ